MERKINIGIVAAEFNYDVTYTMVELAKEHAKFLNAEVVKIIKVPGAYDIPFGVKILLSRKDIDCVVTLGAIIEGQTEHDEIIAQQASRKIMDLSLEFNKPVALGISGPGMSRLEAHERVDYAKRAVEAAVKMCRIKFENEEEKGSKEGMAGADVVGGIIEGEKGKKKRGRPRKKKIKEEENVAEKVGEIKIEEIRGPAKLKKIKDEEKKKIVEEIKNKGSITTRDIMEMFNVNRNTALVGIRELIKEGWIKVEGRKNTTRYVLA